MAANSLTERNDERTIQAREETRSNDTYTRPPVNIIETEEGLILTADLPGAKKESLDVNVETSLYREFELANYYRQFSIPESLDHEKAQADYTNGILTLRIPKAEVAKPKRIEVRVG